MVGSHVVSSETAAAFRLPKNLNANNMQNTIKTAGKTAEWKPEYEGATMVFIIDCHWNHNIENPNTTQEDFEWLTRYAEKRSLDWFFRSSTLNAAAIAERSVA